MKRIFLIILDSLGIGAAPDARLFGDAGANTLKSAYNTGRLNIPNLIKMGLSNIDGIDYIKKEDKFSASVARLMELSLGKDTTIGHWEIAGLVSKKPLPTYPGGFPEEIIEKFKAVTGRGVICNSPYSGTEVIRDFGEKHKESGDLIVYTSADSVFQIAANEAIVPPDALYKYCAEARKILTGEHSVGRVIARPFIEKDGKFIRTANRRDFSVEAPGETMLDSLTLAGLDVISVGKISDIFASRGISESIISHGNTEGLKITKELCERDFRGLAFVNLVDFDSQYGHRQDPVGYADAINEFDEWLPSFTECLSDDDALIITADHGCDPSDMSTDHTREYVPLLVYGKGISPKNLGTLRGFGTVARLVCDMLSVSYTPDECEIISGDILL